MHPSVLDFVQAHLPVSAVAGARVLEVGSFDVNGSVRPWVKSLKPAQYMGVDVSDGPGVDLVVDCERLCETVGAGWDVVISTEMLEHVADWRVCMEQMVDALAVNGWLLATTRSPGFPYHPFPQDNWRFTRDDIAQIVTALGLAWFLVEDDPQCPGVFVLARKTTHVNTTVGYGRLDGIDVARVDCYA
jgi:hypothetical protein